MLTNSDLSGEELPLGFGMALAQNLAAMQAFSQLSPAAQQQVIDRAHQVNSKREMAALVQSLVPGGTHGFS